MLASLKAQFIGEVATTLRRRPDRNRDHSFAIVSPGRTPASKRVGQAIIDNNLHLDRKSAPHANPRRFMMYN